ncbi:hypothetical protein AVEN_4743-1 [Araneus ventricosus]|uniref:Transposase Tc1-like domain-containing protein n=1 Tax=Araneus ventricosus TaxID=182803 RepID=A0A4Y2KBQ7_ARAVE|nr:hypothetical protein AVEN_4743-1 [Araneus ventricosus]
MISQQHDLAESVASAGRAFCPLEAGRAQSVLAAALAVSQSVISRLWNRFLKTGNVRRKSEQGRRVQQHKMRIANFDPPLKCHRATRRRWTQEHLRWGQAEWCNVLFMNEFHFSGQLDNRRIIWRERGIKNNHAFVHENARFGGGGVMVWTGVSIDGHTDLHIIRYGALTA